MILSKSWRVVLGFIFGVLCTYLLISIADAGPLVSADHSTLTVKAKNGYYWDVKVNDGEPQRIQAERNKETNIGTLNFDITDILSQPGQHVVHITVYNYYGTTARVFPVVIFDVFENGTFTYRNSPLYLGIKPVPIPDLEQKEE